VAVDAKKPSKGRYGKAGGKEPSVAVLGKALAVLNALAATREATTPEVAELLGEPRSSVYRLLDTLDALGLVEAGSHRGTYRLGLKLFELGSTVLSRLDLRTAALEPMRRLSEDTGETVFLCLRRGREAVCIERMDGIRAASMALQLGGSLPLHCGASPVALLAAERRSEWDAYISGGKLKDFRTGKPVSGDAVIKHLEETRRTGVAVSDGDLVEGFAALGVPIYDYRGDVSASLAISAMREIVLGDESANLRARLQQAAAEVSRSLGYDDRGIPSTSN
jgi:DNA-binding IclR family transcriptional regulator